MGNHEKARSGKEQHKDADVVVHSPPDQDTRCGIGCFKPRFLQPVAKMIFFVPALGLSVLLSQALGIYLISQITTIEKQFGISSTESGILLAANEIGFMATVLFWSHFARRVHTPRLLAACSVLFAIACAMCAIPHGVIMAEEGDIYDLDKTSVSASQSVCRVTNETRSQTSSPLATASPSLQSMAYAVVAVSLVIQGISKAPRTPLGSTYIDDNVPQTKTGLYFGKSTTTTATTTTTVADSAVATTSSSTTTTTTTTTTTITTTTTSTTTTTTSSSRSNKNNNTATNATTSGYHRHYHQQQQQHCHHHHHNFRIYNDNLVLILLLGLMIGLAILGPLLGSSFGGVFSRIYVTLEETSLTPRDPRFVGAWWLGFVVLSGLALLSALPLVLYPRRMPSSPKDNSKEPRTESFKELLEDSHKSMWRLVTNPLLMIMILCEGISMFTVSGRVSFFPKYLEEHFRVERGQSSILLGATVLVGAIIGSFLSGIVTTCAKLTIRGCLIVIVIFETAGAIILLSGMAVTCEQTQLHGLTLPSDSLKLVAVPGNWSCSTSCHCTQADYLPSCGSDRRTYYSPCHAGCNASLQNRDFANCACITASANRTVSPGVCEEECESLTVYLVMAFVTAFVATIVSVPNTLTKLRSVDMKDRSLSIGATSFVNSALGFFLGPIVFGAMIDSSCILWDSRGAEEGKQGYCALYNTADIRFKMHIFTGGIRLCILALYIVSLVVVFKVDRYKKLFEEQKNIYAAEKTKQLEKKQNNMQNGAGKVYKVDDEERDNADL